MKRVVIGGPDEGEDCGGMAKFDCTGPGQKCFAVVQRPEAVLFD